MLGYVLQELKMPVTYFEVPCQASGRHSDALPLLLLCRLHSGRRQEEGEIGERQHNLQHFVSYRQHE